MVGYALLMMVPFAWQVITSFKTDRDALRLTIIPDPFTLQGWEKGFLTLEPPIPQLFVNSIIVADARDAQNLVLASTAGYAFARLRFPGREFLFLAILGTLMIPDQLRFVPVYLIERQLGLITRQPINYLGVVLSSRSRPSTCSSCGNTSCRSRATSRRRQRSMAPDYFTTFLRIMLPLAGPALAAVSILAFQGAWNGFFWPLLILQDQDHWTLPLGLFSVHPGVPVVLAGLDGRDHFGDPADPRDLHLLPALLRGERGVDRCQGLRRSRRSAAPGSRTALRAAAFDFYHQSIRLVPANVLWGIGFLAVVAVAFAGGPIATLVAAPFLAIPYVGVVRLAALTARGRDVVLSDVWRAFREFCLPALAIGVGTTLGVAVLASNVLVGAAGDSLSAGGSSTLAASGLMALWVVGFPVWILLVDPERTDRPLRDRFRLAILLVVAAPGESRVWPSSSPSSCSRARSPSPRC